MSQKKRRRPSAPAARRAASTPADPVRGSTSGREEARRQRREEARRQREALHRRYRRRRLVRRGLTWGATLVLMGALVGYFVFQNQRKGRVAAEAERVALAAGCTKIERKSDQGKQHGQPPFSYSQHPATSGTHAPAPLPPTPHVYPSPVEEGQAVHNLEHGYVWIYYRQAGNEALSDAVVSRLEGLADRETKVLMAPYPTLPEGQALALVAWNRLEQCPSGIAPDQAARVAQAFIGLFRSGGDAPESQAP